MNEDNTNVIYVVNEEPTPLKETLAVTAVAAAATVATSAALYGLVLGGVALYRGGVKLVAHVADRVRQSREEAPLFQDETK